MGEWHGFFAFSRLGRRRRYAVENPSARWANGRLRACPPSSGRQSRAGAGAGLRAASLYGALGASDPRRGLRSYERDCAAKTNARGGLQWCHSLRKSVCFSMCAGSAYWFHFSAKSLAISTNGLVRSELSRLLIFQDFSPRSVPNRHLQGALRTKRFLRTSVPTAVLAPHALSLTTTPHAFVLLAGRRIRTRVQERREHRQSAATNGANATRPR